MARIGVFAQAPENGVEVEPLDVRVGPASFGSDRGHERSTRLLFVVDGPDDGMGAAIESGLVLFRKHLGMVVWTDGLERLPLKPVQSLSDHERRTFDRERVDRVQEIRRPEAGVDSRHDRVFGGHHVVDLARAVTVMTSIGGAEVSVGKSLILARKTRARRELEEVCGRADRDERALAEVLVQ